MTPAPLWKAIVLLFLLIALLDAQSFIGSGSTVPLAPFNDDVCTEVRSIVADSRNLCWYYVCQPAQFGQYKLFPRRCSLGTHVSPSFKVSQNNPCTQKFPVMDMYDCTRRSNESEVDCTKNLKCQNGGKAMQQDNYCWCDCPPQWQGSPDCSKAKGSTPRPQPFTQCPEVDWCGKAKEMLQKNPCQNEGTCVNQCSNFYCNCTVPYMKTRYCEEFSCSTTNFTCSNPNENCTRGLNGKDEFYVCRSNDCANYLKHWY